MAVVAAVRVLSVIVAFIAPGGRIIARGKRGRKIWPRPPRTQPPQPRPPRMAASVAAASQPATAPLNNAHFADSFRGPLLLYLLYLVLRRLK